MALPPMTPLWPPVFAWLAAVIWAAPCEAYFGDWSALGGRPHEPTCVDIPKNMSLCSDIGYDKMRLPNLLDHDTLTEVQQQSGSWVPLLNVRCHPHTKLFLCSLFTPVCLENRIFPCRSLCQAVQLSCESRMRTYGYHWPEMLRCDKFPLDNDMCIKAPDDAAPDLPHGAHDLQDSNCDVCNPVDTYENILDNFCRADTVIRARIKRQKGKRISLRKAKTFKTDEPRKGSRKIRILLGKGSTCCSFSPEKQKYLIMGVKAKKNFITPTFVLPWKKSNSMRQAVRMFRNLNCNDPNLFSPTAEDGTIVPKVEKRKKKKKRKRMRKRMKNRKKNGDKGHKRKKLRKKSKERKSKVE